MVRIRRKTETEGSGNGANTDEQRPEEGGRSSVRAAGGGLRLGKEEGVCSQAKRGRREADSEKDGHAVQLVAEITSGFLNAVSVYMFRGKGCHLGFWKDNDQNFPLYSMVRRDVQSGQLDT